jgi:hypothetical protein
MVLATRNLCQPLIKPTHILKKKFVAGDIYLKGASVYFKRGALNVGFVTKAGKIRLSSNGSLAIFSKDNFQPTLKTWFKKI